MTYFAKNVKSTLFYFHQNMVRQAAFAEVDDNLASVAFDFAVLVPKLNMKVFHKSLNVAGTGPAL